MKNVYKVTYDLKIGRDWLGAGNPNGWSSRNVLANGDARSACDVLERDEMRTLYEGKKPTGFRVINVERIAENVLA